MPQSFSVAATNCQRHCNLWIKLIILILIYLTLIIDLSEQQSQPKGQSQHHHYHNNTEDVKPDQNPYKRIKVLIPNLHPIHYQFWLKNHPLAAKKFNDICEQAKPKLDKMKNLAEFQELHSNLTFEDNQYLYKLDYGKQVLGLICSKIKDVSKSCWGYENNCQEIYLMPDCHKTNSTRTKNEHEQKITWFSQADFGYILDRVKERSKYCAPDKKANLVEVSSFECTKHFTTCRGTNLYARFNTSALPNLRSNDNSLDHSKVLSEMGGWGCDLQLARIQEESGQSGRLESWYSELKGYTRLDSLKPKESCDLVEDRLVFFVKIKSTSNLDDYLATFINLYATIHLNNRFSDNNQIIIWDKHLPHSKTFEALWYAFSRSPPKSISQYDGKKVCFNQFIFAMPPNMVDGLHTDKPLIDGCSKSGLYNAFHKHIVHRLRIPNIYDLNFHRKTNGRLFRIAILSRASRSEFRNILNENEIESVLRSFSSNYYVRVLKYNSMDFGHILLEALNSDIIIGLHGTGLAYSLFLPDWAGLIELYDCGKDRYHKLARLRGISYFKPSDKQIEQGFVKKFRVSEESKDWSYLNQSLLLDHDEFINYEINVEQFMELVTRARDHVLKARDEYFKQLESLESEIPSLTEIDEKHTPTEASTKETANITRPTNKPTPTAVSASTEQNQKRPSVKRKDSGGGKSKDHVHNEL